MRASEAGIANAAKQSLDGPAYRFGMCKMAVRQQYSVPSDGSPDAAAAWSRAKLRHPTSDPDVIPRGVPVWWTGGSSGHGHVAISAGGGMCWSTDIRRTGYFDRVPIAHIREAWGLRLVGWSEDIDGVRVWSAPLPPPVEPTRGKAVDAALGELRQAQGTGQRRVKLNKAAAILRSIRRLATGK